MLGIGTAVPAHKLDQLDTAQRLAEALQETPDAARWARRLFKQCGVETRYTCEPALFEPAASNRYFAQLSRLPVPTTSQRMATYKQSSVPLALRAASAAVADARVSSSVLTHLITVSCTGQFLPGLDAALTKALGLRDSINRIPLTFLGCAAGLKAIGLARDIVRGQPDAAVLVVCVELCTLHIQPSAAKEALFGASFFGDGASACVIGATEDDDRDVFELGKPTSALLPEGEGEMVWEVGDHGFDLYLSSRIPALIGRYLPKRLAGLLDPQDTWPGIWAIHPGGKGIIDALESELGLEDEHTRYSRGVLRDFGNMSSATLLFVLNAIRLAKRAEDAPRTEGICLAFGPGLSCELLPIAYRPERRSLNLSRTESDAESDRDSSDEAQLASHVSHV